MRVTELQGPLLDYWVAKAEGLPVSDEAKALLHVNGLRVGTGRGDLRAFAPSTDWSIGGPLIARKQISVVCWNSHIDPGEWEAGIGPEGYVHVANDGDGHFDIMEEGIRFSWGKQHNHGQRGPTVLIAAMRALVASLFGPEVPDETTGPETAPPPPFIARLIPPSLLPYHTPNNDPGWSEWRGGDVGPGDQKQSVTVRGRNGFEASQLVGFFYWGHSGTASDIVADRLWPTPTAPTAHQD